MSLLGTDIFSVTNDSEHAQSDEIEYYNHDLLLHQVSQYNNEQDNEECLGEFYYRTSLTSDYEITYDDRKAAEAMKRHYTQAITLRRISGLGISNYMLAVEELINNPMQLKNNQFGILNSMYPCYLNNMFLRSLFKDCKSADPEKSELTKEIQQPLTFVAKNQFKRYRTKITHYYWKTERRFLVRFSMNEDRKPHREKAFLDAMTKFKIKINDKHYAVAPVPGFQMNVINPSPVATYDIVV